MVAAQSAGGVIPPESRRSVSGFPSHVDAIEGLPLDERIFLRVLEDWVVETHDPGMFPVTAITCIGHADHDPAQGKAFEIDISQRRARNVLLSLRQEINRLSFSFSPVLGAFSIDSRIRFASSGVGSRDAKHAATELQRRKNRRVEIVFERGAPFPPPRPIVDIIEFTRRVVAGMVPPIPPLPKPNFFIDVTPPTRDEWREFIKAIKSSPLRHLDIKTIVEGVINAVGPPPEGEAERRKQWTDGLIDAIQDDERERRKRTFKAPGDPDDDD